MIMKGIFEMSETFLKVLTTAYLAVILLGMFFAINNYYIYFTESEVNRDALSLSDALLSANCLVVERGGQPVKGLFNYEYLDEEDKISGCGGITSCVPFGRNFRYSIREGSETGKVLYDLGDTCVGGDKAYSILYPASLRNETGHVIPVIINVTVEV